MSTATIETPQFTHDSECCTFLGRWRGPEPHGDWTPKERDYDLYYCAQGDFGNPTVICRYGDDGPEYNSGVAFTSSKVQIPALVEARKRAESLGLDMGNLTR